MSTPVRVVSPDGGQEWPSVSAWAQALGVHPSAIVRRGVRADDHWRLTGIPGDPPRGVAVRAPDGRRWESVSAAARDLGCARETVVRYSRPGGGGIGLVREPERGRRQRQEES
jgi:hypothetical protein